MNFREYKLKDLKAMAMYKSKEQELWMNILEKKVYACEKFCVKDKKMFCLITIATGYKNIAIA